MKVIENNKKIIEDALEVIYNKFNVDNLNQITADLNIEYFTSAIKSLEEIEINPLEYVKNLEFILKDIDSQIANERKKDNPNYEEIERLEELKCNMLKQLQYYN